MYSFAKEEFADYYYTHNNNDVCKKFNLKKHSIANVLKTFNLSPKTREQVYSIISKTIVSKSDEEKVNIERKRQATCIEKYGATNPSCNDEVRKRISNGIGRMTEAQKKAKTEKFKKTMANKSSEELDVIKKHRSDATKNHFANMSAEEKESFSKKMSQVYVDLPKEVKESRVNKIKETYKKTCLERYGVDNTTKLKDVVDKMSESCLEKYGVPYFCMHQKCRSALGGNSANSKPNLAFASLLDANNISYEREFNVGNYSYDFKVDNVLIEVDPSITHNVTFNPFGRDTISATYHKDKSDCAKENGFGCIHIFDWDDVNKVVNLLKKRDTVYARKCKVIEVDKKVAHDYLDAFHLQGDAKDEVRLALVYGDLMIVSMMTFGKPRYNKKFDYEIIRYCSNYNVIGGAEKLFSYFIEKYSPNSVISYCDNSKFDGNTYIKLGFKCTDCKISKHWYNMKNGKHITDNLLRQRGFDQLFDANFGKGTSNEELMQSFGFVEIYDCGQSRYEWHNS